MGIMGYCPLKAAFFWLGTCLPANYYMYCVSGTGYTPHLTIESGKILEGALRSFGSTRLAQRPCEEEAKLAWLSWAWRTVEPAWGHAVGRLNDQIAPEFHYSRSRCNCSLLCFGSCRDCRCKRPDHGRWCMPSLEGPRRASIGPSSIPRLGLLHTVPETKNSPDWNAEKRHTIPQPLPS